MRRERKRREDKRGDKHNETRDEKEMACRAQFDGDLNGENTHKAD
jgi:hypothetical protein